MESDVIFEPLRFRNLTVKNRIFRANVAGRFDFYDGTGSQARINFEERFARGGVGAINSSRVPIHVRGRILPNYATIDADDRIPFWRRLGAKLHEYDCAYIPQLSHGGRQRDLPGVENDWNKGLSPTSRTDPLHGFHAQAITRDEIRQVTGLFADGARRALVANPDLVSTFATGQDRPSKPCTYCNECLLHVVKDPFGSYDVTRYDGDYERMMKEIMSFFEPSFVSEKQ